MRNIYFAIIYCLLYCNISEAAESAIEINHINQEDATEAKLSHDRDEIYRLCAERKDEVLWAYNKVHSDKTFQKTIFLERYFLNKCEKKIGRCLMMFGEKDNARELEDMLRSIHYKYDQRIGEIEAVRKEIREELEVSEEDYKASLDSIQQYSFLPSIAELESIVGENEYLKVMRGFCDTHKFDIQSTRVMGENEMCSIRKTFDIKYTPQKMDDGSTFYPASYLSNRWEGLIVKGKIALQVESFSLEESETIDSMDGRERYRIKEKPLMAFKLLDWDLASHKIERAEKRLTRLQKMK